MGIFIPHVAGYQATCRPMGTTTCHLAGCSVYATQTTGNQVAIFGSIIYMLIQSGNQLLQETSDMLIYVDKSSVDNKQSALLVVSANLPGLTPAASTQVLSGHQLFPLGSVQ